MIKPMGRKGQDLEALSLFQEDRLLSIVEREGEDTSSSFHGGVWAGM